MRCEQNVGVDARKPVIKSRTRFAIDSKTMDLDSKFTRRQSDVTPAASKGQSTSKIDLEDPPKPKKRRNKSIKAENHFDAAEQSDTHDIKRIKSSKRKKESIWASSSDLVENRDVSPQMIPNKTKVARRPLEKESDS